MLNTGHGLWHPHHLLYHVFSKYWLHLWKAVFPSAQDYFIVETFSSVWGAATLALVFLFFRRRFGLPVLSAWLGTAAVGFSYGIWFYSVNVEVYMPSLFFTILALYILSIKEWNSKHVWRIVIVHSFAILFHQMNILLTPIILYKIYSQRRNIYVVKSIFWYAIAGIVLVGGMYFIGGWIKEGNNDVASWVKWMRGYTETNQYWQPLSWKTPAFAAMGFLRTFVGGQFLFEIGHLSTALDNFLRVHALQDEIYLVRNLSTTTLWLIFSLSIGLALLMIVLLWQFVMRFREKMRSWGHVIVPLLMYVVVYSGYFFFWMPEILEFWLGQCVICWLLLIGTFRPANRRLNVTAGAVAVLLLLINYFGSIRPMQDINNDIGYARIEKVRTGAAEKDLVILQDPWLTKEFLAYYTKSEVEIIPGDLNGQAALLIKIKYVLAAGNKVYVFQAREPGKFTFSKEFIPALERLYGSRMKIIEKELVVLYEIR